jgi:hypothetical protein
MVGVAFLGDGRQRDFQADGFGQPRKRTHRQANATASEGNQSRTTDAAHLRKLLVRDAGMMQLAPQLV